MAEGARRGNKDVQPASRGRSAAKGRRASKQGVSATAAQMVTLDQAAEIARLAVESALLAAGVVKPTGAPVALNDRIPKAAALIAQERAREANHRGAAPTTAPVPQRATPARRGRKAAAPVAPQPIDDRASNVRGQRLNMFGSELTPMKH